MDKREAGKKRAMQFVTEVARGLKQEGAVELLWWPADPPQPGGSGKTIDTTVTLRIYKGNSWRSIKFAESDIDESAATPAALSRYEGEIAQSLAEL